ncbi:VIT1/CCC1 transporter family protein [Streptococcus sp. H49]|uniref:VIT1/CCC1 transporter family protein n=1 Tax=Streptococcus huangxiaojuni TaxID=3237239 RepID=UPI0034A328C8
MLVRNYAKSIVYGGMDGIITTFAVVAGSVGGNLGLAAIIVLGFSNLFADGFSMAVGDYLSSTTDKSVDSSRALKNALATFLSFNLFGLIPLLSYLLLDRWPIFQNHTFSLACLLVSVALILLGLVKGTITEESRVKEILRTLFVGLAAALFAYYVGQFLGDMIGH